MLEAAAGAAARAPRPPLLLGVTALTSLGADDLAGLAIAEPVDAWVARLATLATASGLGGIVASAVELPSIRRAHPALCTVVPGIRPSGSALADQRRTATPGEAIRAGATYLVVGRPIIAAADPAVAARAIVEEIARAMAGRETDQEEQRS